VTVGTAGRGARRHTAMDGLGRLSMPAGEVSRAAARALRCPRETDVARAVWTYAAERAAADPGRVAVTGSAGSLSYAALWQRAGEFRAILLAHGCASGDRVCVTGPRGGDTVAAYLAIESLNATYVPLDPDWPEQRYLGILRRTRPRCVLALGDAAAWSPSGPAGLGIAVVEPPGRGAGTAPPAAGRARPGDARYVIHTSGTTGWPKGAVVVQQGLLNHLWAMVAQLGLTEDDVVAFSAPIGYVISVWQMLAPLLVGGTVAVIDEPDMRFGRRLISAVGAAGVTVLELVPTLIGWIDHEARKRASPVLPGLRCLLSTGEKLRPDLAGRVLATLSHVAFYNAYGATECSDDVALHRVTPADAAGTRIPAGCPVPNAVLYVLVEEDGWWRAAEPGEAGQLWVGGSSVCAGYLDDPVATRAAFFADDLDSASPTGRLYRTGDLAVVADGRLSCLGRADRQVKVAGVRLELDGIEAVVNRLPGMVESAVVVEDVAGEARLAAYFVAAPDVRPEQLFAELRESLPGGAVPRRWIRRDALPRNRSGKIDYRRMADE
jgi:D-alanine--poly(phosphoribitol) ligase subunit 1